VLVVFQFADLDIMDSFYWFIFYQIIRCACSYVVPVNYHSLPRTSVLRALFDVLLEAGKRG
jgi:hypothetical protein